VARAVCMSRTVGFSEALAIVPHHCARVVFHIAHGSEKESGGDCVAISPNGNTSDSRLGRRGHSEVYRNTSAGMNNRFHYCGS
jgi:hypothetical protein